MYYHPRFFLQRAPTKKKDLYTRYMNIYENSKIIIKNKKKVI